MLKPLSVYIHIPFCIKKCDYCDFLSHTGNEESFSRYCSVLTEEIKGAAKKLEQYEINTVFFGGGTPTVLKAEQANRLLRIINENFKTSRDMEITIEANPGTVSEASLYKYRVAGFNRISFGLQSNNNRLLKLIGRIHDYQTFEKNYSGARRAGFDNINVDMMFALPSQSLDEWENALDYVIRQNPEHVSAYGLILEDGTKLAEDVSNGSLPLTDEETQLMMYHTAVKRLSAAGYGHYEISNFAKPGYHCKHNTVYWRCMEYVGFGLGASSYINSLRFRNEDRIGKYVNSNGLFRKYEIEEINGDEAISEFMFLGLRMMEGISQTEFIKRFGKSVSDVYGSILISLIKNGLLEQNNDKIRLTRNGIDVSNKVFSELLL